MPSKRKRDILDGFDPNRSDPEDENFDPSEARPRRSKKTPRTNRIKGTGRRTNRYRGSDIDDDEDVFPSDSDDVGSFADDDDDENEDLPVNNAGRRARKVAAKHVSYREDSEEEEIADSVEEEEPKSKAKERRIVVLKTGRGARTRTTNDLPSAGTRRTRAKTEDADDFVELTTSGKHQQPARAASRSKSPEAMTRLTRSTRGAKGIKNLAETIPEAPHETSFQPSNEENGEETGGQGEDEVIEDSAPEEGGQQSDDAENGAEDGAQDDPALVQGDIPMEDAEAAVIQEQDPDEEDADDRPIGRRMTRSFRQSISGPPADEGDDESVTSRPRRTGRLIRKGSDRGKKSVVEDQGSDFEPNESAGSDESDKGGADGEDDGDSSSRPSRGRTKVTGQRSKRNRNEDESADELDLDPDELADEAQELKRSSRSRSRRTRRKSTPIAYEERSKRRRTAPVDYTIRLAPETVEQDDDDDAIPAASTNRRRNGAGAKWQRTLNSTFGPFGGAGGAGALLGGPWGTGAAAAAGGADSDSSDDEMGARTGTVGGAVGLNPMSAGGLGLVGAGTTTENAGLGGAPNVGKIKSQKALADADPLGVDLTVDFSKVGGLAGHIDQLKEMVQLPLLYPELFQRFKITPPRGVLFHGPPGTGKTLLARALANSIGQGGRKITFYMRKGADALSKWVGEAEKQLRLLFEEARKTQPSIIFFDEIDGLAPVRSSKQEQIHASIVSTLLALMDGMDGRGQVIVIGATNRPDNIDPALRRPGRFDREFYFPLPDVDARKSILDIHTNDWGLSEDFKKSLAENTKGYGGADIRALCTEAALNAIQRTYPQIYSSEQKLIVDPERINIHATDFMISIKKMVPSSERSATSGAAPLPKTVAPLLRDQFAKMKTILKSILPLKPKTTALEEAMFEPYEDSDHGFGRENLQQEFDRSRHFRPRLLITGVPGMGQKYLAAAILHHFERVHVQKFDLATLLGDGRTPEAAIAGLFTEVKRHKPSVIYLPNVDTWHATLGGTALVTLTSLLNDLDPTEPVLLLATANAEVGNIDKEVLRNLFRFSKKNRIVITRPNSESRMEYFRNLISYIRKSPTEFPDPSTRRKRVLEELRIAPLPPPKPKSKEELKQELKKDRTMLNQLKLRLQPVMDQIKKRYRAFHKPVIGYEKIQYLFDEADPNYVSPDVVGMRRPYEVTKDKEGTQCLLETATGKIYYNLDTTVIEERISNGFYARPIDFYKDIKSLVHDIKNTGDRDRIIKANEMESNVDVDMNDIELATGTTQWEALHQRQLDRANEAEERARRKAAMETAVGMVQSDVVMNGTEESQDGPIRIGAPVPPEAVTTTARFRVMSPLGTEQTAEVPLSNGNSVPSRQEQSGTDEAPQPYSQMGPPPPIQWPRTGGSSRSLTSSAQATAGGTPAPGGASQLSQVSALTSLPPGVSPSAFLNEASTTNDPSSANRSTSHLSTQATNGYHPVLENASQLPDTQPPASHPSRPSQNTASSDSPWMHSQADALAHGRLSNIGYRGNNPQTSPTSSQAPTDRRASRIGLPNLLNNPASDNTSPIRNSGGSASSSQLTVVHDGHIQEFLDELTNQTSGCTIEQLEQINRELMEHIWTSKHEWNRMKVLNQLRNIFNDTITDIEEIQGLGPSSQDLGEERAIYYDSR